MVNLAGSIGAGIFEWGYRVVTALFTEGVAAGAIALVQVPVEGMVGGAMHVYGRVQDWINQGTSLNPFEASYDVTNTLGTAVLLVGGTKSLATGAKNIPTLLSDASVSKAAGGTTVPKPNRVVIDLIERSDGVWVSSSDIPQLTDKVASASGKTSTPSAPLQIRPDVRSWQGRNERIAGAFQNIETFIRPIAEKVRSARQLKGLVSPPPTAKLSEPPPQRASGAGWVDSFRPVLVKEGPTPLDLAVKKIVTPEFQEPNALIKYPERRAPIEVDAPPTGYRSPLVIVPPPTKGNFWAPPTATLSVVGSDGGTYKESFDPATMSLAGSDEKGEGGDLPPSTISLTSEEGNQFDAIIKKYSKAPLAFDVAIDASFTLNQIAHLLGQIVEKNGWGAWYAFQALLAILQVASPTTLYRITDLFFRLLDQLTDHNRRRVLILLRKSGGLFQQLGQDHFPTHFEFSVTVFERWPRLGYAILEGLLEGTQQGIVPHDLTPEVTKGILDYIDQTHGFIPAIYQRYLIEGESLLAKLKIHTPSLLNDNLGTDKIAKIRKEEGDDYLLAIIQMVSPTSGASSVPKSEQLGLMQEMIKAEDRRQDVPLAWRGQVKSFELAQGAWTLKEGQIADPNGKLKGILQEFHARETTSDGELPINQDDLIGAIRNYLLVTDKAVKAQAIKEVQRIVYALAGQNESIKQKINSVQEADYPSLLVLHEIFNDKDNLPAILSEALKELVPPREVKQTVDILLAWPRKLIQAERDKYVYTQVEQMKVGLRAVKGAAFGLHGLSSGVCTATDMTMGRNRAFKLFAITDEGTGTVRGYIHVFETTIGGKKYLTLPGINPSAEFLGTVDAKKMYAGMMEQVIEFAKMGDYAGVYIPTSQTIHSNRSDIHTAIIKSKYPIKRIPQVNWNTRPRPYPFSEVYEVWEEGSEG